MSKRLKFDNIWILNSSHHYQLLVSKLHDVALPCPRMSSWQRVSLGQSTSVSAFVQRQPSLPTWPPHQTQYVDLSVHSHSSLTPHDLQLPATCITHTRHVSLTTYNCLQHVSHTHTHDMYHSQLTTACNITHITVLQPFSRFINVGQESFKSPVKPPEIVWEVYLLQAWRPSCRPDVLPVGLTYFLQAWRPSCRPDVLPTGLTSFL